MVVEKVFSVIAESTRRDILEALAQESKAVGQLVDELGVSQPTVSKHLRVLREAGVVTMRAQGQKRFYGINTEPLALVAAWLESLGAGIDGDGAGAEPLAATGAAATKQLAAKASPADVSDVGVGADVGEVKTPLANSEPKVAYVPAKTAKPAVAETPVVTPERESVSAAAVPVTPAATVSSAPAAPVAAVAVPVAAVPTGTKPVPAAAKPAQSAPARPAASAATQMVRVPQPSQSVAVDNDGGVPRQLGRSVGRAAKKGADLLATFKRRKD